MKCDTILFFPHTPTKNKWELSLSVTTVILCPTHSFVFQRLRFDTTWRWRNYDFFILAKLSCYLKCLTHKSQRVILQTDSQTTFSRPSTVSVCENTAHLTAHSHKSHPTLQTGLWTDTVSCLQLTPSSCVLSCNRHDKTQSSGTAKLGSKSNSGKRLKAYK